MIKEEEAFLQFLSQALMYEGPLSMNNTFPPDVFDSTGKLMLAAAIEEQYGLQLSLDDLIICETPKEVYELIHR